jgi:CAAX protease family protein
MAVLVVIAQLRHAIPLDLMVWLSIIAAVCVLWRGPGWRGVGLNRPASVWRTLAIGIAVGLGYQFFSLYVLEPLIAHSTSGVLPDVSVFRSVVGDRHALAFWTAMSWTRAGFAEEAVYRGWLMLRLAELGLFSRGAWIAALLGSSSAFGAMHFYQGWSGTITAGLTGVVLAIVYLVTGRNLWAAVVAHSVMDTAGFVMIYFGLYPGLYTS